MTLFSGLCTDVNFSGDESGMQWGDNLFELQNVVEWRMAMSRGQDERSQMHAMSVLLNTCSGMTNRVLIGKMDTARRRARTREPNSWCQSSLQHAGGDYFCCAKELVKTRAQ